MEAISITGDCNKGQGLRSEFFCIVFITIISIYFVLSLCLVLVCVEREDNITSDDAGNANDMSSKSEDGSPLSSGEDLLRKLDSVVVEVTEANSPQLLILQDRPFSHLVNQKFLL